MDGPSATIICPGRVAQTGRSLRRERASQAGAHPIAYMRYRFLGGKLLNTIVQVVIRGGIVFAIGVWLDRVGRGLSAAVRQKGS